MVFESIVADILNRYLGEYVENLDKGQLKIGIWGGERQEPSMFSTFRILLERFGRGKMKISIFRRFFTSPTLCRALFTIPRGSVIGQLCDDKSLQSKVADCQQT